MPTTFVVPSDDQFLVNIAYDTHHGEYRAAFVNQNYGVRLAAPTISRLKYRTVHLLRDYVGVEQTKVIFRNGAPLGDNVVGAA